MVLTHEVLWDFRIEPAYEQPEDDLEAVGADRLGARGPTVLPNVYQIQVSVGRITMFGDLTVRQDPRIDVSRADLAARQEAMMSMYQLQAPMYHAGQAVQKLRGQLSDVEQFLRETASTEPFATELEGIDRELDDLNREIRRLRPAAASREVEASTTRPTEDQLQAVERAWTDTPEIIGRINALILVRIPVLYERLNDDRMRADGGDYLEVPTRRGG